MKRLYVRQRFRRSGSAVSCRAILDCARLLVRLLLLDTLDEMKVPGLYQTWLQTFLLLHNPCRAHYLKVIVTIATTLS